MQIGQKSNLKFPSDLFEKSSSPCRKMINEIDSIMQDLANRSKSQVLKVQPKSPISNNFINALAALKHRINEEKYIPNQALQVRPLTLANSSLGPGSYYIERSKTPVISSPTRYCFSPSKIK